MIEEKISVVDYTTIKYKGVVLKVYPEFIQDSYHGSIPYEEALRYVIKKYNESITVTRNRKLEELGI